MLVLELLKLTFGIAGVVLGGLLSGGMTAVPLPQIALIIVGISLAAMSSLYTGYKVYHHGLCFFNRQNHEGLENCSQQTEQPRFI